MAIKNIIERVHEEKQRIFTKIMENLGEIKLDEADIEDIIKNLRKSIKEYIKEILKLEIFNEERERIQNLIQEVRQLEPKKEFLENNPPIFLSYIKGDSCHQYQDLKVRSEIK